jgi:hypothetical protein
VAADCESVQKTQAPTPPDNGSGGNPPPENTGNPGGNVVITPAQVLASVKADARAIAKALAKAKLRKLSGKRGVNVPARALLAGRYTISVTAKRAGSARRVVVAKASHVFTGAGKAKLKLKATRAGRAMMKRSRRASLSLKVSFAASGMPKQAATRSALVRR